MLGVCCHLSAWTRLLGFTGDATVLAACEPKALRYRFRGRPGPGLWDPQPAASGAVGQASGNVESVAVFANIAAIPGPA